MTFKGNKCNKLFVSNRNTLKIEKTSQLKHTSDDALLLLGMTVPELRRLRKLFQKKYSGTYLTKIKNLLKHSSSSSNSGRQYENYATHFYNPRSTAKNRPYQSGDKHGDYEYLSEASDTTLVCSKDVSYKKLPESQLPSKHIISADAITINKQLGVGEFGVVQQGVWTNNGERVSFFLTFTFSTSQLDGEGCLNCSKIFHKLL